MRRRVLTLALLLAACPADPPADDDATDPAGDGIFARGCPPPGGALARVLTDPAERPFGEEALAAPGDVLLANELAAYVIAAPATLGEARTWYLYGGVPIDLAPVDGCRQTAPDRLDAIGFVLGTLDLVDFPASTLRLFRAESVEVVADGADGGPAIVDVHGVDDTFWLIELELVKRAYLGGGSKAMSGPYGVDVTVRYRLDPSDPVLGIEVRVRGRDDGGASLLAGALLFPGDRTQRHAFTEGELSVGGIGLDLQAPFVAASGADASWALGLPEGLAAVTTIAGVTAFLDLQLAFDPLDAGPGQTAIAPFALSVAEGPSAGAAAALVPRLPTAFPGGTADRLDVDGIARDPAGAGVPYARIVAQAARDDGGWGELARLAAGADGAFAGVLPLVASGPIRLRAEGDGRDPSPWVEVAEGPAGGLALAVGARGDVDVACVDGDDLPIPCRVRFARGDGAVVRLDVAPDDGPLPLPPGTWEATLSRGYEHAIVALPVVVPAGGVAEVAASLPRVIDTAGWISMDSHVHAEPSPDSDVLPVDRMRSAAATGLEVVIGTDHEAIVDLSPSIAEAGLDGFLAFQLGSEVTAPLPEHTNAWPFPARPAFARGEHVRWYGRSLGAIYAAERERGARVVQLNHARVNGECGILCVLDYDRVAGAPRLADPTLLGLPADEPLWSWEFDAAEVMNSVRSPFPMEADPRGGGMLLDWLSFWNLGHPVLGVAVTDVHGAFTPGEPRTYLAVADDDPGAVTSDALVEAALGARGVISAGAFADVSVGGAGPGDLGAADGGTATLSLRVQALPEIDVRTVFVLVNCDAALELPATDPSGLVKLVADVELPLTEDAHVVVLGMGQDPMPTAFEGYGGASVPRFLANPVRVDADGDGVWTPPGGKECALPPALVLP